VRVYRTAGRKNSSTQPAKAAKKAIAKAPKAIAKAPKAKAKAPKAKAKAEAPKAKAKRPLPLAPIGSYRDGSPRLLTWRAGSWAGSATWRAWTSRGCRDA
jgi:hypothetical protein